MSREEITYLAPYIASFFLSLSIFLSAWHRRQVRGAGIYAWFVAGQTLTILGFLLELLSPNLQTKIFWDKVQWLTDTYLITLPFLIFAIRFSEREFPRSVVGWGILGAFLAGFTALLLTDDRHHLIYVNPHLTSDYPFPDLSYDFTFVVYLYSLFYGYGVNIYGIVLLLRRAFQPSNPYRAQFLVIVSGFSITLILSSLSLWNIKITPQRDLTPFSFAIGNLIVAWGLFRYGLFDIVPIARERIIENMGDPVIVLDPGNRVVDINPAALEFIGNERQAVVGRPFEAVFAQWPEINQLLCNPEGRRKETSAEIKGQTFYLDIHISPILNKRDSLIGWIFVVRDITTQKNLEMSYRRLSAELEQRVLERTRALQESEALFRAVVNNSYDGMVMINRDRLISYASPSIMRINGYTPEEVTGTYTFHYVHPDDLPMNMVKLQEMLQTPGATETNEFRLRHKLGHWLWAEAAMTNLLEDAHVRAVIVIIRDITQRKQAEADRLEAYDTTLEGWAKALELKDKETEGHSRRVTETTLAIACAMNFNESELVDIRRGSLLHDIGKMGIPDEILRKKGPLSEGERKIVMEHPKTAFELLKGIPYLEKALEIPYCHHEKWDGSGYPRGLKGEEIPLSARIFAIVDVWDALSSDRPYRRAWPQEEVSQYLLSQSGTHFDPQVVEIFLSVRRRPASIEV